MTVAIHSDIEFYAIIGKAVSKAIDEVIERVFAELQKEIERDIYGAYKPRSYKRSEEGLLDAWKHEVSGLSGNIEFQPDMLPDNPDAFQHNSPYGWDVRDQIFDILERGYGAYNYHTGKPIPPRPMWDDFLAKIDSKIDRWIKIALRRQGLVLEVI